MSTLASLITFNAKARIIIVVSIYAKEQSKQPGMDEINCDAWVSGWETEAWRICESDSGLG